MQFVYSPLAWGFLLMGVPILVHLINMLRHRRQKWAAMEFLLESHRRNRRWVMLKQWLLLLARIAAMGLLVFMLAKWVSNSQWLSWFGGKTTHHFVLLDDSFSMAAVNAEGEASYTRALRALTGLIQDVADQPGDHQLTLVRWSRAALAMRDAESESNGQIDLAADLLAQSVPSDPARLLDRIAATEPTAMQCSPETAVELILPAIASQTGESPVVYMLSDLSRNQFGESDSLKQKFQQLGSSRVPIHLIDCAEDAGPNLTIASLAPQQEVWAAGVPLLIRFSVRNASLQPARNVVAKIRTVDYSIGDIAPSVDHEYSGNVAELPPVVIESIEPGQTVSRQFQVVFPSAGQHVVEVSIPDDSLATDNRRWGVIDIRTSQRVLLVDGDVRQQNAFYFESVLQPGERLRTGITFERTDGSYLRDASVEDLLAYDSIALLDVPRLDAGAIDHLMEYASAGGGVLIVLGANTNLNFANEQLYRNGKGLLPVKLDRIEEVPTTSTSTSADTLTPQVVATDHVILEPLLKLSTSPFFALRIRKHIVASHESLGQPGLDVVAMGPNSQPLIVDRASGAGRVVAILTGLSPDWSTWPQDPTFVVLALRSMGYLSSFRRNPTDWPVSSDLEMTVPHASVLPEGDILMPARGGPRVRLQRKVDSSGSDSIAKLIQPVSLQDNADRSVLDGLLRSGVFECWMTSADGGTILRNFAHNVAPEEGDLDRLSHAELLRQNPGIDLVVRSASTLTRTLGARQSSQSNLAMALLVALLVAEQMLAYSASFHAKPRSSPAANLPQKIVPGEVRQASRHDASVARVQHAVPTKRN